MSLFSMVLDVVIAASDLIIHTSQTPMSSLALFPLAKFQRACIDVVSLGNGRCCCESNRRYQELARTYNEKQNTLATEP